MSQLIMSYPCVGWSRYQSNGKEGFYLNVIESYPEGSNSAGCFQSQLSAPYSESSKVTNVSMSLDAPATIELKCRLVTFRATTSLVCDEIIKVIPAKSKDLAADKK